MEGEKKQDSLYVFYVWKQFVCGGLTDLAKQSFNGKNKAGLQNRLTACAVMTDVCPSGCLVKWSMTNCTCYSQREVIHRDGFVLPHVSRGRKDGIGTCTQTPLLFLQQGVNTLLHPVVLNSSYYNKATLEAENHVLSLLQRKDIISAFC